MQHTPRLFAEINLDHLAHNFRTAQQCAPNSQVMCVIKADAYGHGAVPVAQALSAAGAKRFAVATPEEGLQLRRHGVKEPLLLLGMVDAPWAAEMAQNGIAMAVGDLQTAKQYAAALQKGQTLAVHIKLDTGMHRLGLETQDAAEQALAIAALPGLTVEGLFSHFAVADEPQQDDFTNCQLRQFLDFSNALAHKGLTAPLRHCANSAGTLAHRDSHLDMVRPGIMLYGSNPCPNAPAPLKPVMSLRTRIAQIRRVPAGERVSYGLAWAAPRDSLIATLGVGYADGLFRPLSGKVSMLVRGQRAPQVGRICMDMCMLDVTDVSGVQAGDVATVFGADGEACITADEVAAACGTISYEVLCAVDSRVPRLYYRGGELVEQTSYISAL